MIDIAKLNKYIEEFNEKNGHLPWPEGWPLCGCASDEVVEIIIRAIEACANPETAYDATVVGELARHLLASEDLIEHGTAIRGSWLTDEGRALLAQLQKMAGGI